MGRNSRDDGLGYEAIWINKRPIRTSLVRKTWTYIAKECYKRGCNCMGCKLIPLDCLDSISECRIKDYVIAYIKKGFYPNLTEESTGDENDRSNECK